VSINPDRQQRIQGIIRDLLDALGYAQDDPHTKDTPLRVAKMFSEVLDGPFRDYADFEKRMTVFEERKYNGIIMEGGVPFYSFCAHHMALFTGRFSIGYYPKNGRILGLSKLIRIFREGCRFLTTQEAITEQAVTLLSHIADTEDVICHVVAEHTCMSCRGVQTHGALTTTVAYRPTGIFAKDPSVREQFLAESRALGTCGKSR
jgi:GTP cyclohydrolase I